MCLLAMEGRTVISAFLFAATEVLSVETDNQATSVIILSVIPQLPLPKIPTLPLEPFICIQSFLAPPSGFLSHSILLLHLPVACITSLGLSL